MQRLNVLLLPHPRPGMFHPWFDDVLEALKDRHECRLYEAEQPLVPQFEGVDAVIDQAGVVSTQQMMDIAADAGVRLWQILGTGFDKFDLAYMKTKGIPVANTPGQFSSIALAETAMMLMLMLAHGYREAASNFTSGYLYHPVGGELVDRTLAIIGFGASGQDLARRAKPFGMHIQAIDVRPIEQNVLEEIEPQFLGSPDDLDRVISESDFVSLHLHLNDQTRHTLDRRRIGLMKSTAYVINVARGALVDEEALYDALVDRRIGGAGLDTFATEPVDPTHPAYQLPNVVVLPHIAGCTDGTSRRRAACAAENIDRIAQGLAPLYRIG